MDHRGKLINKAGKEGVVNHIKAQENTANAAKLILLPIDEHIAQRQEGIQMEKVVVRDIVAVVGHIVQVQRIKKGVKPNNRQKKGKDAKVKHGRYGSYQAKQPH